MPGHARDSFHLQNPHGRNALPLRKRLRSDAYLGSKLLRGADLFDGAGQGGVTIQHADNFKGRFMKVKCVFNFACLLAAKGSLNLCG